MEDCNICLLDLEKRQEETSLKVNCKKPQYIQFLQNNLPKEFYVCFKYLMFIKIISVICFLIFIMKFGAFMNQMKDATPIYYIIEL